MNLKFWRCDLFGTKRIAALEKRIEELEEEIQPRRRSFHDLFANLWSEVGVGKPLRLHEKVERICEHLQIEFKRTPEKVETRKIKRSR